MAAKGGRAARQASFEQQLSSMPMEFLQCRTVGHNMHPATLEVERGVFELGVMCSNGCGLEVSIQRGRGQRSRGSWYGKKEYLFVGTGRLDAGQRDQIWETYLSELQRQGNLPRRTLG